MIYALIILQRPKKRVTTEYYSDEHLLNSTSVLEKDFQEYSIKFKATTAEIENEWFRKSQDSVAEQMKEEDDIRRAECEKNIEELLKESLEASEKDGEYGFVERSGYYNMTRLNEDNVTLLEYVGVNKKKLAKKRELEERLANHANLERTRLSELEFSENERSGSCLCSLYSRFLMRNGFELLGPQDNKKETWVKRD